MYYTSIQQNPQQVNLRISNLEEKQNNNFEYSEMNSNLQHVRPAPPPPPPPPATVQSIPVVPVVPVTHNYCTSLAVVSMNCLSKSDVKKIEKIEKKQKECAEKEERLKIIREILTELNLPENKKNIELVDKHAIKHGCVYDLLDEIRNKFKEPCLLLCSNDANNESSCQSLTNINNNSNDNELLENKQVCYSAPELSRSSSIDNNDLENSKRKSNFKEFANTSIKAAHIVASSCQQKYFKN
jgi:hypothetical protein